ncbi:MAG: energy transducer TonB, partial [Odoribacter sp.]|nr:energy transducer TonB [Odoribacter sp.]
PPPPRLLDTYQIVEDNLDIDDDLEIVDVEDDTQNEIVVNQVWGEAGGEDTGENEVFRIVEVQPSFKGDMNAWLKKNLNYPPIAQENGIQGRVYIQFVVEKDGSITDVNVVRSVDAALDREALRVVKAMPSWNPGKQRGRAVRTQFTLPIVFQLQ